MIKKIISSLLLITIFLGYYLLISNYNIKYLRGFLGLAIPAIIFLSAIRFIWKDKTVESSKLTLNKKYFLFYKLLNSSFTGLSIGIIYTIYEPINDQSTYSLGGIILALSMLLIAMYYEKLLNINSFFKLSLFVELLMLMSLIIFLIYKISLFTALTIYCIYQLSFVFGGYLVRAETLVANDKEYLGRIDILKQIGYLIGLLISYTFYKTIEHKYLIKEAEIQISLLHYPLIILQFIIIICLYFSFKRN